MRAHLAIAAILALGGSSAALAAPGESVLRQELALAGKARFSEGANAVEQGFRRWYVGVLRATGQFPSDTQVAGLTPESLFPAFGFKPNELTWSLSPSASDPRFVQVCLRQVVHHQWQYFGMLDGMRRAGYQHRAGPQCEEPAPGGLPQAWPAEISASRGLDVRDIAIPTLLSPFPWVYDLIPRTAQPAVVLSAPPGEWGAAAVLNVLNPDNAERAAAGYAPGGATAHLGATLANLADASPVVALTTLSPENFQAEHDCDELEPGMTCQLQIAFRGRPSGIKPLFGSIRVEFANGAVTTIGVQGNTTP